MGGATSSLINLLVNLFVGLAIGANVLTVCQLPAFHHVEFVYASYPVTWMITTAAHIICYAVITKKIKKSIEAESLRAS